MSNSSDLNIPLFKVFSADTITENLKPVFDSGYIGQGKKVDEFENEIANFIGNQRVVSLNSATSGIHLALHMLKDGIRDEVITTPLTCTATNFPIVLNGLKVVWADIDKKTCNISLESVRSKIGPKTLAVIVVHWGGNPVDLDGLNEIVITNEYIHGNRPMIIEDCAHAFGTSYSYSMIGDLGNINVFSFQAIKHLTTGDGGAILLPNEELYQRAKLLRWYGLDRTSSADFRCEQNVAECGFKFHMNDIAATIGLENFKHIKWILAKHRANYREIRSQLQNNPNPKIFIAEENPIGLSARWIMTLLVEDRDNFMKHMKSRGIDVSRVHDRNDKHQCLQQFKCDLPNTDYVCERMCCIPCGWWLTHEDVKRIVEALKEY